MKGKQSLFFVAIASHVHTCAVYFFLVGEAVIRCFNVHGYCDSNLLVNVVIMKLRLPIEFYLLKIEVLLDATVL